MKNEALRSDDPSSTIEEFVRSIMTQSGALPVVCFVTFSGSADDWRKDDKAVYLRVTSTHALDSNGKPYEVWARLCAPGFVWNIPTVQTEMLLVCPPFMDGVPAAGWVFHSAQLPPTKLDQGKSFLMLPDGTQFLVNTNGFVIRSRIGETDTYMTMGADRTTGEFVVGFPNGHNFSLTNDGYLRWQTKSGSSVDCMFEVGPDGLKFSLGGKIAFCLGVDAITGLGTLVGQAGGKCLLNFAGGQLGASNPLDLTGPHSILRSNQTTPGAGVLPAPNVVPPTPSTTWTIGG